MKEYVFLDVESCEFFIIQGADITSNIRYVKYEEYEEEELKGSYFLRKDNDLVYLSEL